MKTVLCTLLLLILQNISAQTITAIPNSSLTACDGIGIYTGSPVQGIQWAQYAPNQQAIPSVGDSLTNMCSGLYLINVYYSNGDTDTLWLDMNPAGQNCENLVINLNYLTPDDPNTPNWDGVGSITATGGSGPYTYYWNTFEASNGYANYLGSGQICAGVMDANGCYTDTIFSVPATSGMDNPDLNAFRVYPNPTLQKLRIKSTFKANSLQLTDLNGNVVYHQYIDSDGQEIIVDVQIAPGVYLLHLLDNEKRIVSRKVVMN